MKVIFVTIIEGILMKIRAAQTRTRTNTPALSESTIFAKNFLTKTNSISDKKKTMQLKVQSANY
jgi:hypothetical protein